MAEAVSVSRDEEVQSLKDLYWTDGYTWALRQADSLRRRDFAAVDWDNVIEEIEDVAKREQHRWTSRCATLVEHLLKLEYWRSQDPETGQTWFDTVTRNRQHMQRTLDDSPGLKAKREEMLRKAWHHARKATIDALANYETGSRVAPTFRKVLREWERELPETCPYTLAEIEDPHWWPENARHKFQA